MTTKKVLSTNVISLLKSAKKCLLMSILALSTVSVMAYGQQSGIGQVTSEVKPASPQTELETNLINIVTQAGYTLLDTNKQCSRGGFMEFISDPNTGELHVVCRTSTWSVTEDVNLVMFNALSKLGYNLLDYTVDSHIACQYGFTQVAINDTSNGITTQHYICKNNTAPQETINAQLIEIVTRAGYTLPKVDRTCVSGSSLSTIINEENGIGHVVCRNFQAGPVPEDAKITMFNELSELGFALFDSHFACQEGFTSITINDTLNGTTTQHYICENNTRVVGAKLIEIFAKTGYAQCGQPNSNDAHKEDIDITGDKYSRVCRSLSGQANHNLISWMFYEMSKLGYTLPWYSDSTDNYTCSANHSLVVINGIVGEAKIQNFFCKDDLFNQEKIEIEEAKLTNIVNQAGYTLPTTGRECTNKSDTLLSIGTDTASFHTNYERHLVCKNVTPNSTTFVGSTPTYSVPELLGELSGLGYTLPGSDLSTCPAHFKQIMVRDAKIHSVIFSHYFCQSNNITTQIEPDMEDLLMQKVSQTGYALPTVTNQCIDGDNVFVYNNGHIFCKEVTSNPYPAKSESWMFGELSTLGYTLPNANLACNDNFVRVIISNTTNETTTKHYLCKASTVHTVGSTQ